MIDLKELQVLLQSANTGSTTFQSIVITSLQTLSAIQKKEVHANQAALSLGQQTKVQGMIERLEELQFMLLGALNKRGKQMLNLQKSLTPDKPDSFAGSWWDCVDELVETIALGIECIGSIIKSQPRESLARVLGLGIIDVLSEQHKALLAETDEQLIGS